MTIFQRVAGIKDMLGLLSQVKFDDIAKLVELVRTIGDDTAELRARVLAVIAAADILVDYTETQADDQVVLFVQNLAQEDGLWSLVAIVQDLLDGGAVPVGSLQGEGLALSSGKGSLPWPLVIQLAQVIVMVIQTLTKKAS